MTKIDNIFTITEARLLNVEELQTQKEKKTRNKPCGVEL